MNYKLKEKTEDFIVKEIPKFTFNKINGKYLIYKLKKTNRNTEDCIQFISKILKIPRKYVGYAGTKDKNAITEQFISFYNIENMKKKIENNCEKFENFELNFEGYFEKPLSLGDLKENNFEITIRNISEFNIKNPEFIINYFDDQRFSENNKEIGKFIIKKEFKKAVELLEKQNHINEEILKIYSEDPIRILRTIPLKTLKFFVHSYQSYLFNETCKKIIKLKNISFTKSNYSQGELYFALTKLKNIELPIIGFGTNINEKYSEIINEILEKEKINTRDFIIKSIPELSSFGTERNFITNVINFNKNEFVEDELNKDKKKIKINFSLEKGSYATIVIKKIFSK